MLTSLRDLWPEDLKFDEIATPLMILKHQASQLETRSNRIIRAEVTETRASDRVEFGFDIIAPALNYRTSLFKVQGQPGHEYPVVIVPPAPLPVFLQSRVFKLGGPASAVRAISEQVGSLTGHWEDNDWVASTEQEFVSKLEKVLASPEAKSVIQSLIVRSTQTSNANGGHAVSVLDSSP